MIRHNSGAILRQMQSLLSVGTFGGLSDRELLERFLERRDEGAELAFAVLVERHGPMVLGVCRRIVRDPHDAEDAFQATFLVLARKGRSIRVEGSLGRWLFGVATRVATRARSDDRRRRVRERPGLDRIDAGSDDAVPIDAERAEARAIVAREIGGLPARYQAAVILCDLEGTSHEEAARRLGWPVGTVKSRLSRARARLRDRLTRRGLAPADLSIVTAILPVAPSPGLVATTTRAAQSLIAGRLTAIGVVSASVATLTQGVLRTMVFTRIKIAAALLVAVSGSAALLGQVATREAGAQGPGAPVPIPPIKVVAAPKSDDQVDLEMLERAWADALTRRDAAVVGRILADDFEGIDQAGNIYDKSAALRDVRQGVFTADAFGQEPIRTRVLGDSAVVTSRFRVRGNPWAPMTRVYIRRNARWRCVASHASWATGVICPGISATAAEETLRKWNDLVKGAQPQAAAANSCTSCHGTGSQGRSHYDPALASAPHYFAYKPSTFQVREHPYVQVLASAPHYSAYKPSTPLHVEIDAAGAITIEGKPIASDKNALEERLKAAGHQTGRTELVLSAAPSTPYHVVAMISAAAQNVGLGHITLTQREGRPNPPEPLHSFHGQITHHAGGLTIVRPPFDGRVDKVHVSVGEAVKTGDPLIELFSADLAAARSDYEIAMSQWRHDKRIYDSKKPRIDGALSIPKDAIDAENDEAQSRLKMKAAREKLEIYGLTEEEITNIGKEEDRQRSRFTLRSRVDGVVVMVGAVVGNFYDRKDVLIQIRATPAPADRKP